MKLPVAPFKRLIVLCDGKWKPARTREKQESGRLRLMRYPSHDRNMEEFAQWSTGQVSYECEPLLACSEPIRRGEDRQGGIQSSADHILSAWCRDWRDLGLAHGRYVR
jgi:hypothetical protein